MGLEVETLDDKAKQVEKFEVTERLYIDADGKIVPEDSPDAAFLYSTPGKRVPMDEAIEKGLTKAPAAKKAKPAENKQAKPAQNKGAKKAPAAKKA